MAILVRASHQMRAFEDRFLTIGLPYRVIGGHAFYERMEIRDAMAYFRVAVSPDDDLAFERIVNTPKRGLGDKAIQTMQITARDQRGVLVEGRAAARVAAGAIKGKGGQGAGRGSVRGCDRWHGQALAPEQSHVELAEVILEESGYTAPLAERQNARSAGTPREPQGTGQGAGAISTICKGSSNTSA